MTLRNRASIAGTLTSLVLTTDDAQGGILPAVITHAPGDGAHETLVGTAASLGMETLVVYTPPLEYHSGEIDIVSARIERAVATGRPVFVLLDQAHGANAGVVRAIAESAMRRVESATIVLMAIVTHAAEERIAGELAEGASVEPARFRTADENVRLVSSVALASA